MLPPERGDTRLNFQPEPPWSADQTAASGDTSQSPGMKNTPTSLMSMLTSEGNETTPVSLLNLPLRSPISRSRLGWYPSAAIEQNMNRLALTRRAVLSYAGMVMWAAEPLVPAWDISIDPPCRL